MSDIRPALTADEWKRPLPDQLDGYVDWDIGTVDIRLGGVGSATGDVAKDRHKLAALALNGQEFGFTHADVALIRRSILVLYDALSGWRGDPVGREGLAALADRIESLLPPEG